MQKVYDLQIRMWWLIFCSIEILYSYSYYSVEPSFLITMSVLYLKQYCRSSLVSLEMYYFAYDTFPKVLRTYNCHKRIIVMWVSTSILNFFAASRMKKKEGLQSNRLLSGNKWKWALDIVRYVGYQNQDNAHINWYILFYSNSSNNRNIFYNDIVNN